MMAPVLYWRVHAWGATFGVIALPLWLGMLSCGASVAAAALLKRRVAGAPRIKPGLGVRIHFIVAAIVAAFALGGAVLTSCAVEIGSSIGGRSMTTVSLFYGPMLLGFLLVPASWLVTAYALLVRAHVEPARLATLTGTARALPFAGVGALVLCAPAIAVSVWLGNERPVAFPDVPQCDLVQAGRRCEAEVTLYSDARRARYADSAFSLDAEQALWTAAEFDVRLDEPGETTRLVSASRGLWLGGPPLLRVDNTVTVHAGEERGSPFFSTRVGDRWRFAMSASSSEHVLLFFGDTTVSNLGDVEMENVSAEVIGGLRMITVAVRRDDGEESIQVFELDGGTWLAEDGMPRIFKEKRVALVHPLDWDDPEPDTDAAGEAGEAPDDAPLAPVDAWPPESSPESGPSLEERRAMEATIDATTPCSFALFRGYTCSCTAEPVDARRALPGPFTCFHDGSPELEAAVMIFTAFTVIVDDTRNIVLLESAPGDDPER